MKKLLVILLVIGMFVGSVGIIGSAESLDLKPFTDEEIVALLKLINQEIANRRIEKTAELKKGYYIAGKDLPLGDYILAGVHEGDWWTDVNLYTKSEWEKGQEGEFHTQVTIFEKYGEVTHKITLNEGDVLEVSGDGKITLTIFAGPQFK
ncbi:MAG: hypothetical protein GXZ04_07645 [Clostridiales bacterium]|nr:hypothetical protein [Clostridiales bacterium]